MKSSYTHIITNLRSLIGLIDFKDHTQLKQEVITLCDYLEKPIFRIAVFAPFNYGKSTLLNALLGQKTLPIDLIPTTGAAIYVSYGQELRSSIKLNDGTEISELGTDLLKKYAVLDEQRRMNNNVTTVQVFCPHPFLKMGIEFMDLPGTNDREAQDNLVQDKLLTADLIIQVLDARKLMTLGERENLRDWLWDRGITTVVFVVNFINLLEPEEQKNIQNRLRFLAESFRGELPSGISNIYRVDALPALRAILKGDLATAQTTGLTIFESALHTIAESHKENLEIRLPRLKLAAHKVLEIGVKQQQQINEEINTREQKHRAKIELLAKGEKLIKQGLQKSLDKFKQWLCCSNLLSQYQLEVKEALQNFNFLQWQEQEFKPKVNQYQKNIEEWVDKAGEFFAKSSSYQLLISYPEIPKLAASKPPQSTYQTNTSKERDLASIAIPTGVGWILGGPVGAAVLGGASYLLNKIADETPLYSQETFNQSSTTDCLQAAQDYLTSFSEQALLSLEQYEKQIEPVMSFTVPDTPQEIHTKTYQLQLLSNLLQDLNNFTSTGLFS